MVDASLATAHLHMVGVLLATVRLRMVLLRVAVRMRMGDALAEALWRLGAGGEVLREGGGDVRATSGFLVGTAAPYAEKDHQGAGHD